MRSYSVALAALAIGSSQKWLDNTLSHFPVPHVSSEKRGVARRIPHSTLVHLALARELHEALGLGVGDALTLAERLLQAGDGAVSCGGHLRVTCDRSQLEHDLSRHLHDALESAPAPRRGRPARGSPRGATRARRDE